MWYYVLNNQQAGPTDENGLKGLLATQTISPTTLLWKEGMTDWVPFNQTELSYLLAAPASNPPAPVPAGPVTAASVAAPAVAPYPAPVYGQPYAQSPYPQYPQPSYAPYPQPVYAPGMPYPYPQNFNPVSAAKINELDQLMTWFWVCFGTGFFLAIPWIAAIVIYFVILHKCWQVVQDGYARTTPGQAIGFMFIPIFNFYWQFVALHGLAKDMNAYKVRHGIYADQAPEGLALATCITACIPYVDFIVTPILGLILIGMLKRSACSILSQTR